MNWNVKNLLVSFGLLALVVLGLWWWFANMHLVWVRSYDATPEGKAQPFLAATWLLEGNGFTTSTENAIDHVDMRKLPAGTVVLGGAAGVISSARRDQLLAWVARGNTLVFQPRVASKEEVLLSRKLSAAGTEDEDEDQDEDEGDDEDSAVVIDALSAAFAVRTEHVRDRPTCTDPSGRLDEKTLGNGRDATAGCPAGSIQATSLRQVSMQALGRVVFDGGSARLIDLAVERKPLWSDTRGDVLRGYQHGKGQVVMAPLDIFTNTGLRFHDHGALLLGLARINSAHKHVTIVKSRSFVPWYELLWVHYKKMLLALAAVAVLLFWRAVRRFGPVLPDPAPERRSLMEHIDASGAWLWKARGGRDVLIDAARADLLATLQRRAPALLRLHETHLQEELARLCGLTAFDVAHAMHHEPAREDEAFTRQIRTLQTLRKHYER